jgi:hypothetical protein
MSRFAIASNFDDGRRFFIGAIDLGSPQVVPMTRFVPQHSAERDSAFRVDTLEAAQIVALGLTELSSVLPPKDSRTWYAVQLPEAHAS